MRLLTPSVLSGACLAALLTMSACAGDDAGSASDTASGQSTGTPDPTREEVDEPRPRLVVASDAHAAVLDPDSGEVLGSFPTAGPSRLSVVGDERHVALVDADEGTTQFLDAGSWSSAHGEHSHHYVAEPALRTPTIEGRRPVHVVSNAGRTAVFHDDDGTAEVFDDDGLLIDSLETTTVDSGEPHHGVVVPLDDGALVTIPGPDELPGGVARVDEDGAQTARFEDCPGLHGEIVVDDTAVFGCETGLMLVTDEQASTVPNPDDSGERVGGFVAGAGSVVVGDYAADSLAVVDVAAGTFDGHGGLQPSLALAGHRAFVADPETFAMLPVDLDTFTAAEPIALDDPPTDLVAVGGTP